MKRRRVLSDFGIYVFRWGRQLRNISCLFVPLKAFKVFEEVKLVFGGSVFGIVVNLPSTLIHYLRNYFMISKPESE